VHADWFQIGAQSGRMACRNPNLQNLPRDPRYRACIRPGEGLVLIKADYAQIELRLAAELAGERRMIEAFRRGEDLHRLTASLVLGKPPDAVTKDDRQLAKAINFGLVYGMGATAFAAHARTAYGVTLSEAQAAALREKFFQAYPALRRWHRAQPDGSITTRTVLGRKRFGVERFTEKLNTPVQGSGADGLKAALAELWETRERCPAARPVLAVHDEIVVEVPADAAEAARQWLVDCMTRGMQAVLREVPVEVEAMISRDFSGASP
jgi:DNA polymerase-1